MDQNPLVSIIIPVYNGSNYLREAIDSALGQSYRNCEVIVVNDGSNDNGRTEQIALSYGEQIRYFSKENGGVASALNLGIQKMEGEYFSWLSHDDVYYPNKIQSEIESVLRDQDKTKTVLCDYEYWDMSSNTCRKTDYAKIYNIDDLTNSVFSIIQFPIHMCSALIHRSQFERVGYFDEHMRYYQDVEFAFRLLRGQRSLWIADSLYKVRVHGEADTVRYSKKMDGETAIVYENMLSQLTDSELKDMFGTAEKGVCKLCGHIFSSDQGEKLLKAEERLFQCYKKSNNEKDIVDMKQELKKLCGGKELRVVLYGAGRYGKRLYYELKNRQIAVESFMDLDSGKKETMISDIICKEIEDYDDKKGDILVIVTPRQADAIALKLRKHGFLHVITRQELEGIMINYSPQL